MSDAPQRLRLTHHVEGASEGLLEIVLDHPRGNVLDMAMMRQLAAALEAHASGPGIRAVLLGAAGRHFSFGASVPEHRPDQAPGMLSIFHGLVRRLVNYPVPIVAAVQGRCLGGAFEVALCCHVVLAARDAAFACPEIKLGVFPPVLAALGTQRLGGALAERLVVSGDELPASRAHAAGFVAELLAPEGLMASARSWCQEHLLGSSGHALRQAVAATRAASGLVEAAGAALDAAERRYLEHIVPSHDGAEGIEAFIARREPVWTHR